MLLILIALGIVLERSAGPRLIAACLLFSVASGLVVAGSLLALRRRRHSDVPQD